MLMRSIRTFLAALAFVVLCAPSALQAQMGTDPESDPGTTSKILSGPLQSLNPSAADRIVDLRPKGRWSSRYVRITYQKPRVVAGAMRLPMEARSSEGELFNGQLTGFGRVEFTDGAEADGPVLNIVYRSLFGLHWATHAESGQRKNGKFSGARQPLGKSIAHPSGLGLMLGDDKLKVTDSKGEIEAVCPYDPSEQGLFFRITGPCQLRWEGSTLTLPAENGSLKLGTFTATGSGYRVMVGAGGSLMLEVPDEAPKGRRPQGFKKVWKKIDRAASAAWNFAYTVLPRETIRVLTQAGDKLCNELCEMQGRKQGENCSCSGGVEFNNGQFRILGTDDAYVEHYLQAHRKWTQFLKEPAGEFKAALQAFGDASLPGHEATEKLGASTGLLRAALESAFLQSLFFGEAGKNKNLPPFLMTFTLFESEMSYDKFKLLAGLPRDAAKANALLQPGAMLSVADENFQRLQGVKSRAPASLVSGLVETVGALLTINQLRTANNHVDRLLDAKLTIESGLSFRFTGKIAKTEARRHEAAKKLGVLGALYTGQRLGPAVLDAVAGAGGDLWKERWLAIAGFEPAKQASVLQAVRLSPKAFLGQAQAAEIKTADEFYLAVAREIVRGTGYDFDDNWKLVGEN